MTEKSQALECCFDKWSHCHTAFVTSYVYTYRFVLLSALVREASFCMESHVRSEC